MVAIVLIILRKVLLLFKYVGSLFMQTFEHNCKLGINDTLSFADIQYSPKSKDFLPESKAK